MKKYTIALIILICLNGFNALAKTLKLSLAEAENRKLISVKSFGSTMENNTQSILSSGINIICDIESKTQDELILTMESGRMFEPLDLFPQPLLVVTKDNITLKPMEKIKKRFWAFCANKPKSSPFGQKYKISKIASPELVLLSEYIYDNSVTNKLAQDAVWSYTNQLPFTGVSDEYKELTAFMTKIPELIKKRATRNIKQKINFFVASPSKVSIDIIDEDGKLVRSKITEGKFAPGHYDFFVNTTAESNHKYQAVIRYQSAQGKTEEVLALE